MPAALLKPSNGSNADYPARVDAVIDLINNGNYNFPSTQVPSADANVLDDYEEGTWTPSVGGTATYTQQIGLYTKIGRMFALICSLTINVIGTGSTTAITGAPFTASQQSGGGVSYFANLATNVIYLAARLNSVTVYFAATTASAASITNTPAIFGNSASVDFTIVAFV